MSKFMFHLKFSKKDNYVNEHEVFEMMRSRDLYQVQFDLRLKLKKHVRALETEKRVQASTFYAKRAVFLQKMSDKVNLRNKIQSKQQRKDLNAQNAVNNAFSVNRLTKSDSLSDREFRVANHDDLELKDSNSNPDAKKDFADIIEHADIETLNHDLDDKQGNTGDTALNNVLEKKCDVAEGRRETRAVSYAGKTFPLTRAWKSRPGFVDEVHDSKTLPEITNSPDKNYQESVSVARKQKRLVDDSHGSSTEKHDQMYGTELWADTAIESVAEVNGYIDNSSENNEINLSQVEDDSRTRSLFPPLKHSMSLPSRGNRVLVQRHSQAPDKPRRRKRKTLSKADKSLSLPEIPAPKPMMRIEIGGTTPDGKLILSEADYEEYLSKYRKANNNRLKNVKKYSEDLQEQVDSFKSLEL